jgi:hypothetical protein
MDESPQKETTVRKLIIWLGFIVAIAGMSGLASADPGNFGQGTYGSCNYTSCGITISSGTVSINVTPTASGLCTVAKDSVSVQTDDSNGYIMTINTSGTTNTLASGSNSFTASTGTQTSPVTLINNSWGYRVDSVGGFGSGPTSAQSSAAAPATAFAAVPNSSQTGNTIVNSSAAADPAVNTSVWYGACATTSLPSGTYSNQVVYTVVGN